MRWLILFLSISLSPVPNVAFATTPGEIVIGDTLPDIVMLGLNGQSSNLSAYRGKPLIINVWASWCGPCRAEMASLERLAWLDNSRYFTVIGVSTDDYLARAEAALKTSNATINHYIDSGLRIEKLLGASRIPLTVLVDAEGRVIEKVFGAREWDEASALELIGNAFGERIDHLHSSGTVQ